MFFPFITRPARRTAHEASLIESIFTNEPFKQSFSSLFINDVSDHLSIFTIATDHEQLQAFDKTKHFTFSEINNENLIEFKSKINNVNWVELPDYYDPSLAYRNFLKI